MLPLGDSAMDVWRRLVRTQDRSTSVSTEHLFGHFPIAGFPELHKLKEEVERHAVVISSYRLLPRDVKFL